MALTPDAIPTNEQLLESLADRVYEPRKKQIWVGATIVLGGIVAYLAVNEYRRSRRDEMWGRYHEVAQQFDLSPFGEPDVAAARKQIESMQLLLKDYPSEPVTPFALQQIVKAQVAVGEHDAALKTLDELRTRFRDFPLNTLPADVEGEGQARSLAAKLEDTIKRERDWTGKHTYVHKFPSDDRLAFVETTAGNMWLGFYSEAQGAPNHVESFVRHAKSGDYNGTQIYSIIQGVEGTPERFEAGSKASGLPDRGGARDPAEHDRDEPMDTIEPEDTRATIHHLYRVVSAAKMNSGESSMRFVVVAKRDGAEKMNGEHTPFAAVMDREKSLETVDRIGRMPTYGTSPETKDSAGVFRMRDHPYPAIYIRRVSIFSREKLEDGHGWDTSRVGKSEAEPWEASLTSPRPEEFEKATPKKEEKEGEK